MTDLHQAWLSLGSNIEAERNLPKAMRLLREAGRVVSVSSVWESESVGFEGPNFLNACVLFLTCLQPVELKEQIIRPIEEKLGRIRSAEKNAPRTIDIDIVLFDQTPLNTDFWGYAFVAVPLAELIPDFQHPVRYEKLSQVSEQLQGGVLPKEHRHDMSESKDQVWIVPRPDVVIS